jgi:hypothetical protein
MSHVHHALIYVGLCPLPLLIMLPLWLLDADRAPRNEIAQEQPGDEEREPDPEALPSLAVRLAA